MTTHKFLQCDEDVQKVVSFRKRQGNPIVLCTGCFDVLHIGHVHLLEEASERRASGEAFVIVGINDDLSVQQLKGPTRPINNEKDRAYMLAALECVDAVFLIRSTKVTDAIRLVAPDDWLKGGGYTLDTLDKEEVAAAREVGADIVLVPMVEGKSTTEILKRC